MDHIWRLWHSGEAWTVLFLLARRAQPCRPFLVHLRRVCHSSSLVAFLFKTTIIVFTALTFHALNYQGNSYSSRLSGRRSAQERLRQAHTPPSLPQCPPSSVKWVASSSCLGCTESQLSSPTATSETSSTSNWSVPLASRLPRTRPFRSLSPRAVRPTSPIVSSFRLRLLQIQVA